MSRCHDRMSRKDVACAQFSYNHHSNKNMVRRKCSSHWNTTMNRSLSKRWTTTNDIRVPSDCDSTADCGTCTARPIPPRGHRECTMVIYAWWTDGRYRPQQNHHPNSWVQYIPLQWITSICYLYSLRVFVALIKEELLEFEWWIWMNVCRRHMEAADILRTLYADDLILKRWFELKKWIWY